MTAILRITSRRDGFRRAGIAHPARPVDHPADRFTPDQVEILKAEHQLVIEELDVDIGPAETSGDDGGGKPPAPPPAGEQEPPVPAREEGIKHAMREAARDPTQLTASGKPKTEALEALYGLKVSARERDALWAEVLAETA